MSKSFKCFLKSIKRKYFGNGWHFISITGNPEAIKGEIDKFEYINIKIIFTC